MSGFTVNRSAVFASAAAAISVTRAGAQPSMPTLAEVQAFLDQRLKTKTDAPRFEVESKM
jgi:ribokinase